METRDHQPFFNQVLNSALLAFVAFFLPALAASVLRSRGTGWLPLYSLQIVEAALLATLYIFRGRLPFSVRLGGLIIVLYAVAVQGALTFNIAASWIITLFLAPILVAIFSGQRSGQLHALGGSLGLALLGLATLSGWRALPDMNALIMLPGSWVTIVFAYMLFVSIGIFATGKLRAYFLGALADAQRARDELSEANAELEQRVSQRTAQLETTNKEVESFAYSVSHDLRAPLRGIDGYSKLLEREFSDTLAESGREYVQQIRGAAREMNELIEGLLTLSQLKISEVSIEEVDLGRMAENILKDLQRSDPGRRVEWQIEPGLLVRCDRRMMFAAMLNLLENSWKFTRPREVGQIAFGRDNSHAPHAYFVRDNGIGFDARSATELFGVFRRLHADEEYPGLGIGLATVQRIIHRHGGRIWAEAAVDEGATFFFTLADPDT